MTNETVSGVEISTPSSGSAQTATNAEKMVPESLVGKVAAKERNDGYEKGYAAALAAAQQTPAAGTTSEKKVEPIEPEELDRLLDEKLAKRDAERADHARQSQLDQQWTQVKTDLAPKLNEAKNEYSDFAEIIEDSDINQNAAIFVVANEVANSGHVIYELAKSPAKLSVVTNLLAHNNYKAAKKYVTELSQSIKSTSSKTKVAPNPLSTLTPSSVNADSGKGGVLSAKAKYKGEF